MDCKLNELSAFLTGKRIDHLCGSPQSKGFEERFPVYPKGSLLWQTFRSECPPGVFDNYFGGILLDMGGVSAYRGKGVIAHRIDFSTQGKPSESIDRNGARHPGLTCSILLSLTLARTLIKEAFGRRMMVCLSRTCCLPQLKYHPRT